MGLSLDRGPARAPRPIARRHRAGRSPWSSACTRRPYGAGADRAGDSADLLCRGALADRRRIFSLLRGFSHARAIAAAGGRRRGVELGHGAAWFRGLEFACGNPLRGAAGGPHGPPVRADPSRAAARGGPCAARRVRIRVAPEGPPRLPPRATRRFSAFPRRAGTCLPGTFVSEKLPPRAALRLGICTSYGTDRESTPPTPWTDIAGTNANASCLVRGFRVPRTRRFLQVHAGTLHSSMHDRDRR